MWSVARTPGFKKLQVYSAKIEGGLVAASAIVYSLCQRHKTRGCFCHMPVPWRARIGQVEVATNSSARWICMHFLWVCRMADSCLSSPGHKKTGCLPTSLVPIFCVIGVGVFLALGQVNIWWTASWSKLLHQTYSINDAGFTLGNTNTSNTRQIQCFNVPRVSIPLNTLGSPRLIFSLPRWHCSKINQIWSWCCPHVRLSTFKLPY